MFAVYLCIHVFNEYTNKQMIYVECLTLDWQNKSRKFESKLQQQQQHQRKTTAKHGAENNGGMVYIKWTCVLANVPSWLRATVNFFGGLFFFIVAVVVISFSRFAIHLMTIPFTASLPHYSYRSRCVSIGRRVYSNECKCFFLFCAVYRFNSVNFLSSFEVFSQAQTTAATIATIRRKRNRTTRK